MSPSSEQLLTAALALPEEDRLKIAEALLGSLQPDNRPPFDDSWREVVQRRTAEIHSGQVAPIPGPHGSKR